MLEKLSDRVRVSLTSHIRYIYALIDPRDNRVRYVGVTKNVYIRLGQHIRDKSRADSKTFWILELKQLGLLPELEILEVVEAGSEHDDTIALERERYWIHKFLRSGVPLLNNIGIPHTNNLVRLNNAIRHSTSFSCARVEAKLNILRLAEESKVSPSFIQCLEKGEKPVKIELAIRVCKVLSRYLGYEVLGIKVIS